MGFDGAHGFLGLAIWAAGAGGVGKVVIVRSEEPDGSVSVEDPAAPAAGEADFRLERPAGVSDVDETGGIVLAGGSGDGEADADEEFLMPLCVFGGCHGGRAEEIGGEADGGGGETGAVDRQGFAVDGGLEVSNGVGEGDVEVGGAAEEVHGVKDGGGFRGDA